MPVTVISVNVSRVVKSSTLIGCWEKRVVVGDNSHTHRNTDNLFIGD
jgi:hypothetical protein